MKILAHISLRAAIKRIDVPTGTNWSGAGWYRMLSTLALLAGIIFFQNANAKTEPLRLGLTESAGISAPRSLEGKLARFADPEGKLTLGEVAAADAAGRFEPIPGWLGDGFSREVIWLRFDIEATPEAPILWWLVVRPPLLDRLVLFSPRGAGHWFEREITGDSVAFSERSVRSRDLVLALKVEPGKTKRYYLRIDTTSSMNAMLMLWQPAAYAAHDGRAQMAHGIYFGGALLVLLFNAIFWYWLRENTFLVYLGYIASTATVIACLEGYVAQYVFPAWPAMVNPALHSGLALLFAFTTWFAAQVFDLKHLMPRLHFLNKMLAIAYLMVAFVLPFLDNRLVGPVLQLSRVAATMVLIVVILGTWRRRPIARAYAVAFLPLIMGAWAIYGRNFGLLPVGGWTDYALLIGSLCHMILLSLVLTDRVRRLESDRRLAHAQLLEASQRAERELERKVAERTSDLAAANLLLESEVAERRTLENELQHALIAEREAMESQRQFVAMVSHEFRTPLAIIDLVAQRLAQGGEFASAGMEAGSRKIRRAVRRLLDLVNNSIADERLTHLGAHIETEPLDLERLLQEAVDGLRAGGAGRIQLDLPGGTLAIQGDRTLLAILLNNLLDNAVKYSTPGSPIAVAVRRRGNGWDITVASEGGGIGADEVERIFERYYRGRLAVKSGSGSGTGLGLHIARSIARRHGGDLILKQSGHPVIFEVLLPVDIQGGVETGGQIMAKSDD